MKIQDFVMGDERSQYRAWGDLRKRLIFFKEYLPGCFSRILRFRESLAPEGHLCWMFTGPCARVHVEFIQGVVWVKQVYSDSYGLHEDDPFDAEQGGVYRYPQRTTRTDSATLPKKMETVSVTLDHHMDFQVRINGNLLISQHCPIDLSQHQLQQEKTHQVIEGVLESPDPIEVEVRMDSSTRYQTMIGFGGTTSPATYALLSDAGKGDWWQLVKDYNLLIQREYPIGDTSLKEDLSNWDHLEDAVPHYYGNNFPNGEISDFAYNRQFQEMGGEVWFEFWHYPVWIRTQEAGERPFIDQQPDPEKFAYAVVGYCKTAREKSGRGPAIVGVQNENCQTAERLKAMVPLLRQRLDEEGFEDVKIHMANAPQLKAAPEFVKRHRAHDEVWDQIDYAASNLYSVQDHFKDVDAHDLDLQAFHESVKDKPFLSIEVAVNEQAWQHPSHRVAMAMGQVYHKNLTLLNAAAICYCWNLLHVTERSFGWTRSLFVLDLENGWIPKPGPHARVFGAYSRHIHRGMTRVETTSSQNDLLASAFTGPAGDQTLILLNRGPVECRVHLQGPTGNLKAEIADPYHPNLPADHLLQKDVVTVPGGSVVTIYT